ncbi:hypothetical protein HDC90_000479 [Pedobacter sp. AK013]|uniref:hypothetical protein n=1 Tax=Pedobacter sp. AK013 TaxID=2723071 RepID=UPI001622A16E|nr:hypothetical protein [Pedobacter sp. AK013]MBB6235879.1 hypothetical protein [Pedobacter sp. AK013]
MKKLLILSLFIVVAMTAKAQIKKSDSSGMVKPVINSKIKAKIIETPPTQTTPVPITGIATGTVQRSTGTTIPTLPSTTNTTTTQSVTTTTPAALPDLVITNISFSPNTANTYFVNYTLKNIGTAGIKKGLLSVQSYLNGNASGGGNSVSLGTEVNQLLNPGESISSKTGFNTTGVIVGNAYTFELCVNGMKANIGTPTEAWVGQQFPELSYTNNSIQSAFTIAPPPPAAADINVVITRITKSPVDSTSFVRIYYTLKNIGETAIPQTASLSQQARVEDTDNDPNTFLETACCGQAIGGSTLDAGDIPHAPGETKELYFDARVAGGANFSTLPKNALYKFNIQITGYGFTDGNSGNNKSTYDYRLQ